MSKIVVQVVAISGDFCRDRDWSHCPTMFDTRDYSRFNVFLRTGQVLKYVYVPWDVMRQRSFMLFFYIATSVVRTGGFFPPFCFIIGDREFLTGGPAALRHTPRLLGRRMFLPSFFFLYRLYRDKSGARCLSHLSLCVKIKIVSGQTMKQRRFRFMLVHICKLCKLCFSLHIFLWLCRATVDQINFFILNAWRKSRVFLLIILTRCEYFRGVKLQVIKATLLRRR